MPRKKRVSQAAPITVITRVEQVEPLYLNKKQLAQSLLVSERTIDTWRERSVIPFLKIRGVIRFNLADVRAALERHEIPAKK
jgi:hypothetical protein